MYRRFIAIILATAVAITGLTAAPARADNDRLLKILGGVAAVAIIGAAIKEAKDNDKVARRYPYYNTHRPQTRHRQHKHHRYHKSHGYRGHHKHHKHSKHHGHNKSHKHHSHDHRHRGDRDMHRRQDHRARPLPNRVQRKLLPASCRIQARNRGRGFLAYSNWCLDRKYRYTRSLPGKCALQARNLHNNKRTKVYDSNCLNRHGYAAVAY